MWRSPVPKPPPPPKPKPAAKKPAAKKAAAAKPKAKALSLKDRLKPLVATRERSMATAVVILIATFNYGPGWLSALDSSALYAPMKPYVAIVLAKYHLVVTAVSNALAAVISALTTLTAPLVAFCEPVTTPLGGACSTVLVPCKKYAMLAVAKVVLLAKFIWAFFAPAWAVIETGASKVTSQTWAWTKALVAGKAGLNAGEVSAVGVVAALLRLPTK